MRTTTLGVLPTIAAGFIALAGTATAAAPAAAHAQTTRTAVTAADTVYCNWQVDPSIDFLRVHTRPDVRSPVPYQLPGGTHVIATRNTYPGRGGPFRYGGGGGHRFGYMAARYLLYRDACFT
jgi:hypothetical protein